MGPRTNNLVEGFHSKLNKEIGAPHPNIYKLVDILQDISKLSKVSLEKRLNGAPAPKRKRKWIERDEKIKNMLELFYTDPTYDLAQLLFRLSLTIDF